METKDSGTIIVVAGILVIAALSLLGGRLIPTKIINSNNKEQENMSLHNLRDYVPLTWEENDKFRVSPSGNCKTIGATTKKNNTSNRPNKRRINSI